jgi:hypothetical protein
MVFAIHFGEIANRKAFRFGKFGGVSHGGRKIVFVNIRKHGWSRKNLALGKKLLKSWRVRSEEGVGPNNSPLEQVANKPNHTWN